MKFVFVIVAAVLLPILSSWARPDAPSGGGHVVTITVDGLSCPFCVNGLEKNLKKVAGVEAVRVELKKGLAIVTLGPGVSADAAKIKAQFTKAVKKAGFTAREITISAVPNKTSPPPKKRG